MKYIPDVDMQYSLKPNVDIQCTLETYFRIGSGYTLM